MPRFSYPDPDKVEGLGKEMLQGAPINASRMMVGASPGVLAGLTQFAGSFYRGSSLPAPLREIGILRAGYVAGSDYETWQHESVARGLGYSDAQLAAIKQGGTHPDLFSPAQQAVLDFADEFIVKVRVSDEVLAEARRHLSDQQLIDLMFVTGFYMTLSRFLETTGVERDAQAIGVDRLPSAG